METEPQFHTEGLKEIGNLASWTVSTYKPGCGVEALRDEDTNLFWQYVPHLQIPAIETDIVPQI